jgi:hypothetical protein
MRVRAWEKLAVGSIAPHLPHSYSIYGGRLARNPVGPILLSYVMNPSAYSKEDFYVEASALALFGAADPRVTLGEVQRIGGGLKAWTEADADALAATCAKEGEPFLDSLSTLPTYARYIERRGGRAPDINDGEDLVYARVLQGAFDDARVVIDDVVARNRSDRIDWVREATHRLSAFGDLLDADGGVAAQSFVEEQIARNRSLLGIPPQ